MNTLEQSLAYVAHPGDLAAVRALPAERLPKIAVVIPSYNQAEFLPQTLDSVFGQNYPNMEVFVADGGSTDQSVAIIKDYARRYANLRYVSEPDGGQYQAVNKGIDATSGEIIAWINSDDVYLPETFWKIAAFFHFNRCAMIVYGRNKYTDEHLNPTIDYPVDWSPVWSEQQRRMMHFCLPPQPSLFFRRTAVKLLGKLASPILDYELWLRWQHDLPFYFIDDYLSLSRLHSEAKTIKIRKQLIRGICEVVHQHYRTVPYSWTFKQAYNDAYGSSWTKGENPPITFRIRLKALAYWVGYNLRWSPRVVRAGLRSYKRALKESLYGRV